MRPRNSTPRCGLPEGRIRHMVMEDANRYAHPNAFAAAGDDTAGGEVTRCNATALAKACCLSS